MPASELGGEARRRRSNTTMYSTSYSRISVGIELPEHYIELLDNTALLEPSMVVY
jgi:hypothetical protein